MMIDSCQLKELIDYDPETGLFTWLPRKRDWFKSVGQWKNWNGRYPGSVAGTVGKKGYRTIAIHDKLYKAHRLAWFYVHGRWPTDQIDHINGDRDDNRITNLRSVSNSINGKNKKRDHRNVSGYIGVTPYPYHGTMKWVARIRVDGRLKHLGYFDTIQEAAVARKAAERIFGFHPNHGKKKSRAKIRSRGFQKTRW